ncbi:MAG: GTPase HflX, partial [Fibrobacteres bacterium]|nr:GTPase HflX [Fibrobacterota bacterium]
MKQQLHNLKKEAERKERAYLVGLGLKGLSEREVSEQLEELALLADTAGAEIAGRVIQMRDAPDAKFYIGSGKADEIKTEIENLEVDTVIFNDDLSPSQIRNLEAVFECKTIDRSTLILDIFAQHAKTHEAKVAVELAQLNYLSPRLTGMWTHFGQQSMGVSAGGNRIGTRGPGETQLEIDKRIVKKRAAELKDKLDDIERQRAQMKKQRSKLLRVSLVGYTNVGKSTLLNSLTKGGVYAADRLFATLDATTRKLFLAGFGE